MRLRLVMCAFAVAFPLLVATPASAKAAVAPGAAACRKLAQSASSADVDQALTALGVAGNKQLDSLTRHYSRNPVRYSARIGAWCRSHYGRDAVIRHATFVPPKGVVAPVTTTLPSDPSMSSGEYEQIFEGMTLAHVQEIVGSPGQEASPCSSAQFRNFDPSFLGGDQLPCYWWVGPVPDSFGAVLLQDGRVTNKFAMGF